jgi:hypothetical protein
MPAIENVEQPQSVQTPAAPPQDSHPQSDFCKVGVVHFVRLGEHVELELLEDELELLEDELELLEEEDILQTLLVGYALSCPQEMRNEPKVVANGRGTAAAMSPTIKRRERVEVGSSMGANHTDRNYSKQSGDVR